jgi:NitT/TauT family transport system substrate-binding protein
MQSIQSRRRFLATFSSAGAASLVGTGTSWSQEGPPETSTIRLARAPSICRAPQYMTEELLRSEGFTDVNYIPWRTTSEATEAVANGAVDITMQYIGPSIIQIDAGKPIVVLAGIQPGCFELFGTQAIRSVRDLKGKTVAIPELAGSEYTFISSMMTHVGLDPRKDVTWSTVPPSDAKRLLAGGRIDAFLGLPPDPQELRAKGIGHSVVNSVIDRPWSQYFCCMVVGHRQFVRANPVATKRALRAILKAADLCAADPARAARFLIDNFYAEHYEYALQALREIPYDKWRLYDHEDAVRFYALRLQEGGIVKSSPQKIIAQGTDWRFLNQLKRELSRRLLHCMSPEVAVRPEGANHQWRKIPPGELSIDLVADERLVRVTAWVGAS